MLPYNLKESKSHYLCFSFWKARRLVIEYKNKLSSLLEINKCHLEDLPRILKELEEKVKTNVASLQTVNTPIDSLKRNIEGLFTQMKNVSVFISAQDGTFKTILFV